MKKLFLVALVTFFVNGCAQEQNKITYFENEQQQDFDNFLSKSEDGLYEQKNEIQKKEFREQFEEKLFHYVDSVKLFVNWKGRISNIKTEDTPKPEKTTAISFVISYKSGKDREVEFYCKHLVSNDSLQNDYIYNEVKNIRDYSVVYFDGFIRTTNSKEVNYHIRKGGDNLNISYPRYEFWITDIGMKKRADTLSTALQKAIDYNYKIIEPMKLKYLGHISKKEFDKQFKALLPEFNALKSELNNNEHLYAQRLIQCLFYNFLFGD